MFAASTYTERRSVLRKAVGNGLILLPANNESPMNYPGNTYSFRQDGTWLYYLGLHHVAGMVAVLDADSGEDVVFGDDLGIDDVVWTGPLPTVAELAKSCGVGKTRPLADLKTVIDQAIRSGRRIHFLPPYRHDLQQWLSMLTGIKHRHLDQHASETLKKAIIAQRAYKTDEEVGQIEEALEISYDMHTTAMKMAAPGVHEQSIAGTIEGIALKRGSGVAFPIILSIHSEILHNHHHVNTLKAGQFLCVDSGAAANSGYASDITRTAPVGGKFTEKQKPIYEAVLKAEVNAIKACKPGVPYRDIHLQAARSMTSDMKALGLMKGDVDEAVAAGAHAIFFPHGLGHMMGLGVHDMEGLGEDLVGYDASVRRSDQFGLKWLRLARPLEPGFVLTVEPGIYFIPTLIDQWKAEGRHKDFINYEKFEAYKGLGGVRIEDDVLVTRDGHRVLGKPIPKSVSEVEAITATGL